MQFIETYNLTGIIIGFNIFANRFFSPVGDKKGNTILA